MNFAINIDGEEVMVTVHPDEQDWRLQIGGQEVQLQAAEWIRQVLGRLDTGALVVIDYGATAEELESRRVTGTLRTYRERGYKT